MKQTAKAIKGREGYFVMGDIIQVEHVSGSVYRAYGKDALGYPWTCLTTSSKFEIIEETKDVESMVSELIANKFLTTKEGELLINWLEESNVVYDYTFNAETKEYTFIFLHFYGQECTQNETIDAQPTTKDIEVQETLETAKELDVLPHKAVMTYKEAKEYKQQLEEINDNNSKVLNSFEKNSMGFSPDHIRELPEYKKAKENYDKSFSQLRDFNAFFVKKFKKEYAADRKNRYKTK